LFLERAERLRQHLGPILVQLPPRWKPNRDRLAEFLKVAPRHLRWAIEFRQPDWLSEPIFQVLTDFQAALCIHDMIPQHPWRCTTNWTYLRFHGPHNGNYSREELREYAQRLHTLASQGLDVYAYFNNDLGGHALHNARDLQHFVQQLPRKVSA
jgi:uncharacterized protein YecE (DUF72 family)